MKFIQLIISAALLTQLTACASMFGNNDNVVNINSTPSEAVVKVNGVQIDNTTPTKIVVKDTWSPTVISVEKKGCHAQQTVLEPRFQKIGLLNILIWPGFIVDAATGDMKNIPEDQRVINANLC